MSILKIVYRVTGDPDRRFREGDVVDYARKQWLVVGWRKSPTSRKIAPTRMVSLSGKDFYRVDGDTPNRQCYMLVAELSQHTIDGGPLAPQEACDVMIDPPLFVDESELDSHSYIP